MKLLNSVEVWSYVVLCQERCGLFAAVGLYGLVEPHPLKCARTGFVLQFGSRTVILEGKPLC